MTMDTSKLLAEMGAVFGQEFIESVISILPEGDIDEARLVPQSTAQQKAHADRPTAVKKALAAFDRAFHRGEKKRGVEAHRKMRADIEKKAAAAKDDPDEYKKILQSLRAKKADAKSKPKAEPSKVDRKAAAGIGAGKARGSAAAGGGGEGGQKDAKQKGAAGSGAKGQHHPFKNSPNLGKGPGTPPGFPKVRGSVVHNQKKCWNCDCGPVYTKGCICTGTGATKDCKQGAKKHVKIKKDYRSAYNKMYHAWRAQKGGAVTARLKGGGRPGAF
jgi:hypothetical protein